MIRRIARVGVGIIALIHAAISLMGALDGFGLIEVGEISVDPGISWAWLVASILLVASAVGIWVRLSGWWIIAIGAAMASQALVISSWADASVGTVPNVVLLATGLYGGLADGPQSQRARFHRAAAGLAGEKATRLVEEGDLVHLPDPVATYLRRTGVIGLPAVTGIRASFRGRIRGGPDESWMPFTAEQASYFPRDGDPAGRGATRVFHMEATRAGLPVDVLHELVDGHATMHGRLLSLIPVVDASGDDMDLAETVTLFNDLCVFAPAALLNAPVVWEQLDAHRVRGTYTNAGKTSIAVLVFSDDGDLCDFIAEGRGAASNDGHSIKLMPWSTPVLDYGSFNDRRITRRADAVWHAPEGSYAYVEMSVDTLVAYPIRVS